jgi:hypothetical protein
MYVYIFYFIIVKVELTKQCADIFTNKFPDKDFNCFYLDALNLKTTREMTKALWGYRNHYWCNTVNYSDSIEEMNELLNDLSDKERVKIIPADWREYTKSRDFLQMDPLISIWFDSTSDFSNVIPWMKWCLSPNVLFEKGTCLGITWTHSRQKDAAKLSFNDHSACVQQIEIEIAKYGWRFDPEKKIDESYAQNVEKKKGMTMHVWFGIIYK